MAEESHPTVSTSTAYPLNSKRLTARIMARIARSLELPTAASLADTRQMVEGRLAERGHEPQNVEVLLMELERGTTIYLRDEGGDFLEVRPEEERGRSAERTSSTEPELEADKDGGSEAITDGGARDVDGLRAELEAARRRVGSLEVEAGRLQEAAAAEEAKLREEVSRLEEKVERERERYSALWRMNCERLVEHDLVITGKDEEIDKLRAYVKELEAKARSSVHVRVSTPVSVEPPVVDATESITATPAGRLVTARIPRHLEEASL